MITRVEQTAIVIADALARSTETLEQLASALAERFEEKWYSVRLSEKVLDKPEPDWSRVPEEKREVVRAKWLTANMMEERQAVNMWGPQIPWFASLPYYEVMVLGDAVYPEEGGDDVTL